MLLVGSIVAATSSAHTISAGALVCLCFTGRTPAPDDSDFRAANVAGGRLQYDYTFGPGIFIGGVLGGDAVYRYSGRRRDAVWTAGGVLGGRWGDRTTGGLRLAVGAAADFGARPATGYYFDFEGEVAHRVGETTALYLALAIVNDRSLTYRTQSQYESAWSYGSYVLPLMASFGLRFRL